MYDKWQKIASAIYSYSLGCGKNVDRVAKALREIGEILDNVEDPIITVTTEWDPTGHFEDCPYHEGPDRACLCQYENDGPGDKLEERLQKQWEIDHDENRFGNY